MNDRVSPCKYSHISTLSTTHIQPIRSTKQSQAQKNPFCKKTISQNGRNSTRLCLNEFLNYKTLNNDTIPDEEESIIVSLEHKYDKFKLDRSSSISSSFMCKLQSEIDLEQAMNAYLTKEMEKQIKIIPTLKPITAEEVASRVAKLPNALKKHTLVIDIDETLVYSFKNALSSKGVSLLLAQGINNGLPISFNIVKRPFLDDFLKTAASLYNLVAFTASEKKYADTVINYIDPNHVFSTKLYRNSCIERGKYMIKDLRILGVDLSHIVILDNSIISFMSQIENGIPISSFYGDMEDNSLLNITKLLYDLHQCDDVRNFLRNKYSLLKVVHSI